MSERHPGKEHELPSFAPEWGHPVYPPQWGSLEVDVIGRVAGGFGRKVFLPQNPNPCSSARAEVSSVSDL